MKSFVTALMIFSLAGNAVLAFFVLRPASSRKEGSAVTVNASATAPAAAASAATIVTPPVALANWQSLKPDGNLHTLIDNLRSAGFPPAVVRAVAGQLVSERLDLGVSHLPFWKQNPANPEFLAAQQQLATRRREMLNDLLGTDARPSAALDPANRARRYGSLSDEKIDRIETLNRDIGDLRMTMMAERKSGDMRNMMGAHLAAEQEQQAELAAILTPAELEQYEMRSSQTASRLMANVRNLDVTETEYAALFRAQKAFDAADPFRSGTANQESMVLRAAAQEELNEQARAVLTDDRYYEYLKGTDQNYAQASQFTAAYPAITPAMTYDLTQIERTYQTTMMSLSRAGAGGVPSTERMAQLSAARKTYQDQVAALLGPEIATAYTQRNRGGGLRIAIPATPLPGSGGN